MKKRQIPIISFIWHRPSLSLLMYMWAMGPATQSSIIRPYFYRFSVEKYRHSDSPGGVDIK